MSMERTNLVKAREEKNWSQDDLAEIMEVSRHIISDWERGLKRPYPRNRRKLGQIFGVENTNELLKIMSVGLTDFPGGQKPCTTSDEDERDSHLEERTELHENLTASAEMPLLSVTSKDETTAEEIYESYTTSLHISPATSDDLPSFLSTDLTILLESLLFVSPDQRFGISDHLTQILEGFDMMNSVTWNYKQTRREALSRLALLPLVTLGLDKYETETLPKKYAIEDVLTQCTAGIAACRELSNGSDATDITLAFKTASRYSVVLQSVMNFSSSHCKEAASLVAQCFRLKSTLARHTESLQHAELYAQEAVKYAQEAGDAAVLVSAQISQAWICHSNRHANAGIVVISQALPFLKDVSEATAARVISTQSVLEAMVSKKSTKSLNKAKDMLESLAGDESLFSNALVQELIGNQGIAHYHCREYGEALSEFGKLIDLNDLSPQMSISTRSRVDILHYMTLASLKKPSKDIDQTMLYWKEAAQLAKKLQSRRCISKVLTAYDMLEALWPKEQRVIEGWDLIAQ